MFFFFTAMLRSIFTHLYKHITYNFFRQWVHNVRHLEQQLYHYTLIKVHICFQHTYYSLPVYFSISSLRYNSASHYNSIPSLFTNTEKILKSVFVHKYILYIITYSSTGFPANFSCERRFSNTPRPSSSLDISLASTTKITPWTCKVLKHWCNKIMNCTTGSISSNTN